jgi:hypothetical protein
LVGNIYGRLCIKFPENKITGERHRLEPLVFIGCQLQVPTFNRR